MGVSGKSKSQAQTNRKTSYSDELWDGCEKNKLFKLRKLHGNGTMVTRHSQAVQKKGDIDYPVPLAAAGQFVITAGAPFSGVVYGTSANHVESDVEFEANVRIKRSIVVHVLPYSQSVS
jgi:hypothetical protein